MLQRLRPEAELLGHAHEHQDLVGSVAVAVYFEIALEDVRQGLQAQVAARLGDRLSRRLGCVKVFPSSAIRLRFGEGTNEHGLDAEARVRKTAIGAFDVFAQGELDAARRLGKQQPAGWLSVL